LFKLVQAAALDFSLAHGTIENKLTSIVRARRELIDFFEYLAITVFMRSPKLP
jgi:hypothetical protein